MKSGNSLLRSQGELNSVPNTIATAQMSRTTTEHSFRNKYEDKLQNKIKLCYEIREETPRHVSKAKLEMKQKLSLD
jgi:hypothetical protein